MKTIISLFTLLLAALPYALADQPATQQAQQQRATTHQVAKLDRLIEAIHLDLKELKKDHPWLSEYNDKCLDARGCKVISYLPRQTRNDPPVMHPAQINIMYVPIDLDLGDNVVEDVPVCEFPSLKSKIFADVTVWQVADAKIRDAIRSCIIKRCKALQKEMKNEKFPNKAPATGH